MPGIGKRIKDILIFKEPEKVESFILKESKNESENKNKNKKDIRESQEKELEDKIKENENKKVSKRLSENLEYLKLRYTIPTNTDVVLREFDIVVKNKVIPSFIFFIDGMVDRKVINEDILQPLMILSNIEIKSDELDIVDYIKSHILPHSQLNEFNEIEKIIDQVNFGGCGIFIDGVNTAFAADVKGWDRRGVDRPNTELVIRGPQEGFTESLRSNTSLIRKRLRDEDLIAEGYEVGKRSKTPGSLLYVKDIANESLVKEVRRRINSISVDYIMDTGELEQYIEDNSIIPTPQILATERPDRVATYLTEGRVGILLNGSPFCLVVPVTYFDFITSTEDAYLRFPFSNFVKIIRILAIFLSLLLPGIYLAITTYHHEMIPTDLLYAIEASREKVPFPSIIEILIMEVSFELIREAGIRIPGPIGPTLGIIGALILGQAAVSASIVSPILIIIVAVTGIASFAMPNYSLGYAWRILRFAYIFLAAIAGFYGISFGVFIHGLFILNTKSFGVPFMSPIMPNTSGTLKNSILKAPIYKQEKRPDFINPQDIYRQPMISRKWFKSKGSGGSNGK